MSGKVGRDGEALVVGIGNPDRGDDGVGPAVANRLRGRAPPGICILERRGNVLDLMEDWEGFAAVIVVDAAAPAGRPGRVDRLDLVDCPLAVGVACSSTHGFGVGEAVELARRLGRLPRHLIAYLVEGERFDVGAPLSPFVARAVDPVLDRIAAELTRISAAARDA